MEDAGAGQDLVRAIFMAQIRAKLRHSREGGNPGDFKPVRALDPRLREDDMHFKFEASDFLDVLGL